MTEREDESYFATARHPTPPDATPGATQGAPHPQAVGQTLFHDILEQTASVISAKASCVRLDTLKRAKERKHV